MPSGYTNCIYEGRDLSAKNFIMNLSKRFGGMYQITSYGEGPVPAQYSSDLVENAMKSEYEYHQKALQSSLEEKKKFDENANCDELAQMYNDSVKKRKDDEDRVIKRNAEIASYYNAVIEKVEKWNPEPKYQNIKDAALKDLKECKKFDTLSTMRFDVEQESVEEFCEGLRTSIEHMIEYQQEQLQKLDKLKVEYDQYIKGLYEEFDKLEKIDNEASINR